MFPDDATLTKVHIFKGLDEEQEVYMNDEFSKVQGT
jgi:hypothetical protein